MNTIIYFGHAEHGQEGQFIASNGNRVRILFPSNGVFHKAATKKWFNVNKLDCSRIAFEAMKALTSRN